MDPEVAARMKAFAGSAAGKKLTGADKRLLDVTLLAFRRNGAQLDQTKRSRLNDINRELQQLSLQYGSNLTRGTAAWELYVTDEAELRGLPAWLVASAKADAVKRGKPGWRSTLQAPVASAVAWQSDNAALRKTLSTAQLTLASEVNTPNADRQLALRAEKAKLLGYASFADYQTEDRMAASGANVLSFLGKIEAGARPEAARDLAELQAYRREIEGADAPALQPWDVVYYSNKLSKKVNGIEQEMLRPYFPLPRVLDGLFAFVKRFYGVSSPRWRMPRFCIRV
jgi:oligopeptidase A